MKQIFTTLSVYAVVYFVLLTVVLGLLYSYPQVELHMLMNMHHTGFQDAFFKYYSVFAEWPVYLVALICHERNKQRYSGTDSETLVPLTATSNGVRELSRLVTTSG